MPLLYSKGEQMQLQNTILTTFKNHYPNHTLNQSAKLLKINRTRLFRLFNGSEMKISEYESFEKAILQAQGAGTLDLLTKTKECLKVLKPEKLKQLIDQMNEKLFLESLIQG